MRRGIARLGLLVPAAVAEVVAAVLTAAVPSPPIAGAVAVAAATASVAVGAVHVRRPGGPWLLVAAALLGVAIVSAVVAVRLPQRLPPGLPAGAEVVAIVHVDGSADTVSAGLGGGLQRRTTLHGSLVAAGERHLDAPVTVFAARLHAATPGATVRVRLRILERSSDGLVAAAQGPVRVVGQPPAALAAAAALRHGLVRAGLALPGDGGSLLPGLAIGDTTALTPSLATAMRSASLSHLTAVSGANCAVVVGLVLGLGAAVGLPRRARVGAAGAALGAFVVLVTPQPSVLRAAVMAAVALAAAATGRPATGPPLLGIAVLVLLATDPWLSTQAGFVLSALATAGLLLLAGPIADRLGFLPRRLAIAVAVPVAAQVACQPVLILLQPVVPPAGVVANLLAEPAAPVATVLGLVACLLLPVAHPLGALVAGVAWVPSAWIAVVARAAAAAPSLAWPAGPVGAALAGLLVVAALVALHRAVRTRWRGAASAVFLVVAALVAGSGIGSAAVARLALPADWEIAACDVGQGDGLVLNGGGGHFALVDTGRQPAPIAACLARLGVGRVDLMVLTHWDADHVGAARSVASRVGTAFVGPSDGSAADELRHDLVAAGVRVEQVHRGEATRVGRLAIRVLWPPDPLGAVQPGNPASITMTVTGRLTSIFTGDLNEQSQDALLALGGVPHVDVVKVSHHGSADNSPAFYRAVAAGVALISVGAGNDYHHPTARLLQELAAVGSRPFRTDQDGLILVSAGPGGTARVWTDRAPTAAVWTPAR